MGTITFIQKPPFTVDFKQFKPEVKTEEDWKIQDVVRFGFEAIGYLFVSFGKAAYITFTHSWIAFKQVVLGYYGNRFRMPSDIYLVVFKIVFWMAGLVWCTLTTTGRLFVQRFFPATPNFLSFFSKEIDVRHIRTDDLAIDVSHVPATVQVDNLAQMFEKINFTDKTKPGYMADTSRQEYTTIYTVEDLKTSLATFIKHVNGRVSFLGTPPAYDTPRLMAFYQQIENAVRFSIHKINEEIAAFEATAGTDVAAYTDDQLKKYNDLLEDKGRIAIDMAIAGKHCGARYMGEAMSTYETAAGEDVSHKGNLEDSLVDLLARKRKKIAEAQIQTHLGADTHKYNSYMSNLGKVLALPGTANIIEHLSNDLDRDRYLKLFFEEYTDELIIATVQEEIKRSQTFREKITDWLPVQAADWKKDEYAAQAQNLIPQIEDILQNPTSSDPNVELVGALFTHLRDSKAELPEYEEDWEDFIANLFALDEVKKWGRSRFTQETIKEWALPQPEGRPPQALMVLQMQKMNQLKMLCKGLKAITEGNILERIPAALAENSSKKVDTSEIRKLVALEEDTVARIVQGTTKLKDAVEARLDLDRRREFRDNFGLEVIEGDGISLALMEWLLVSHKILLPQEVRG